MRILHLCLIYLGILLFTGLEAQENAPLPLPTLSESEVSYFKNLVEGNNRFAFDLYQSMKEDPGNLLISSYSIVTGLGMPAIGAKGETVFHFQRLFRYPPVLLLLVGDLNESLRASSPSKMETEVLLANALWLDKSLSVLPSFKQTFLRNFRVPLQPVDFAHDLSQAAEQMNRFISQQTQGKIQRIVSVSDLQSNMEMVMTIGAYLKGKWVFPFDRQSTKQLPFQITPQRTSLTDMMQNISHYPLWKGERWDLLVIPYEQSAKGSQIVMVVLLPKKEVPLAELEKNLTWENWQQWKGGLKSQLVTLSFPRFRIDRRLDLEEPLKRIGFNFIFSREADFSGITGKKGIYLNQILHKTSLEIDEKGANMAAAVGMKSVRSPNESKDAYSFIADHPFIFMIWDQRTDSILFIGRLSRP